MLEEPPIVKNRRSTPATKPRRSEHVYYAAAGFFIGWVAVVAVPIAAIFKSATPVAWVAFCFFVLGYLALICAKLDDRRP